MKRMRMHGAGILAGAIVTGILGAPSLAAADDWPSHPVEMIVPFSAGGSSDTIARIVAENLGERLGQKVVVLNKPGGRTEIGYKAAAAAKPDGYTMVVTVPSVVTNALFYKQAFDASKLSPVVVMDQGPYILFSPVSFAPKTVPALLDYIKANPGKVSCAMTGGVGSVACSMLQAMTGSELLKVPYRGSKPATVDLMGGRVDLVYSFSISARSIAQSDKVRALATTAPKSGGNPLPKLPALAESLPGFDLAGWHGIMVPAGTPDDIVNRLNKEINAVLADPGVRKKLTDGGVDPVGGTVGGFAQRLKTIQTTFKDVLEKSGIMPQ